MYRIVIVLLYLISAACLANISTVDGDEFWYPVKEKVFHKLMRVNGDTLAIKFENIGPFEQGLAKAQSKTGKWGYIDKNGKWLIGAKFDDAWTFTEDGLAAVKVANSWGFVNKEGHLVIEPQFKKATKFVNGLARVKKGNKWGYINTKGKMVIKASFTKADDFSAGMALVLSSGVHSGYAYINDKGKVLVPPNPNFDCMFPFSNEELACVRIKDKYGYINKKGKLVIPAQFEDARQFTNGLAGVKKEGKWGFINTYGEMRIAAQYEAIANEAVNYKMTEANPFLGHHVIDYCKPSISSDALQVSFANGLAGVKKEGKWGFINTNGQWVVLPKLNYAEGFYNGLAWVKIGKRQAYINTNGSTVIMFPEKTKHSTRERVLFAEGMTSVKTGGKWGFINDKGNVVVPPKYAYTQAFSHEMAFVKKGKKWLFIDRKGQVKEFPQFDDIQRVTNGKVIAVAINNEWGVVDSQGEWLINPQFDRIGFFDEQGFAMASKGEYSGFVNDKGEVLCVPQFKDQELSRFADGLFNSKKKYSWGYRNMKGEWAILPKYDTASPFANGFATVMLDEVRYVIDKQGLISGEIELSNKIKYCDAFAKNGLAAVSVVHNKGTRFAFIDTLGQTVVPPKFGEVYAFENGLARVSETTKKSDKNQKWGLINTQGEYVLVPTYKFIDNFSDGLAAVSDGTLWGYINTTGELVVDLQFNSAKRFANGIAAVTVANKSGFINKKGQFIVTPKFDAIELVRLTNGDYQYAQGKLIRVSYKGGMAYVDTEGRLLWSDE